MRAAALADYLDDLARETRYWAGKRLVQAALVSFHAAWDRLGDDPQAEVLRLLAEGDLAGAGAGEELTFAGEGAVYAEVHASYHAPA